MFPLVRVVEDPVESALLDLAVEAIVLLARRLGLHPSLVARAAAGMPVAVTRRVCGGTAVLERLFTAIMDAGDGVAVASWHEEYRFDEACRPSGPSHTVEGPETVSREPIDAMLARLLRGLPDDIAKRAARTVEAAYGKAVSVVVSREAARHPAHR